MNKRFFNKNDNIEIAHTHGIKLRKPQWTAKKNLQAEVKVTDPGLITTFFQKCLLLARRKAIRWLGSLKPMLNLDLEGLVTLERSGCVCTSMEDGTRLPFSGRFNVTWESDRWH